MQCIFLSHFWPWNNVSVTKSVDARLLTQSLKGLAKSTTSTKLRCVKVKVALLGLQSWIACMASVDIMQHWRTLPPQKVSKKIPMLKELFFTGKTSCVPVNMICSKTLWLNVPFLHLIIFISPVYGVMGKHQKSSVYRSLTVSYTHLTLPTRSTV